MLTFELYTRFGIAFDTSTATLRVGQTFSVPFTLTGADEKTLIETLPAAGWKAEVKRSGERGAIDVTAPADSSTGKVIVLVNDGGDKTLMRTLTFVAGVLNVSTSSREATAAGGPVTVEIETDLEYGISVPEAAKNWIALSETRGEIRHETLTFIISPNTLSQPREAVIELVSGGTVIETVLIYQLAYYDPAALVLKVEAKTNPNAAYSKAVCLPLYGAVNVTVDWGDGTTETFDQTISTAAAMPKHVYADEGFHYITVTGSAAQLNGNLIPSALRPAIVGILQWGKLGVTTLTRAFYGNTSLKTVPEPEEGAFASVTVADNMFAGCKALESVPANLLADASELTSVASMFSECVALKSVPATLFEKNTKVNSVASLFSKCTGLDEVPESLFSGMPAITNLSGLFTNCTSLTDVPAGIFARQTEAENLSSLFSGCTALQTIPEELFANQAKATNLTSLFNGCTGLQSVPAGLFEAQTEVTGIASMFKGCTGLRSIPEGLLDSFSKVTKMASLFSGCTSLGNLPQEIFKNMPAVQEIGYLYEGCTAMTDFPSIQYFVSLKTVNGVWKDCTQLISVPEDYFPESENLKTGITAAYMFQNCRSLKTVPANLFKNFHGVTTILQIFENCSSLESLPAGLFDNMTKISNVNKAFNGCINFTGESPYTMVGEEKIHLYDRSPDNGFTALSKNYTDCFKNCEKIADRTLIPIAWGGLNDGTKAKPALTLSMNAVEGAEYYSLAVNIKGTELKSGRMGLFTKERLNQFLEEMGGSYEKVCNRNCVGLTAAWVNSINSAAGLSDTSSTLEAGTDYVLLVSGTNVHGTTIAMIEARTADFPAGDANYERYIGTWTVTSTSSEKTEQPLTFGIEVKPYRVNESYTVSSWGITTWGDDYPFTMNYETDGTVSIPTSDYQGMVGGYYVYLKYRFFNPDTGQYLLWSSNDELAAGRYNADSTVTIEGKEFTDPNSSKTHSVSGMEYCLYANGSWYEHADFFKPGFTVSDYTVGPYTMTKTTSAVSPSPLRNLPAETLLPSVAAQTAVLSQPGVQPVRRIR